MTIATMDEFTALPDGAAVRVASQGGTPQQWTKQGGTFIREGSMPVEAEYFVGAVSGGFVTRADRAPITRGDVFSSGSIHYVALKASRAEPGIWRVARLQGGQFTNVMTAEERLLIEPDRYTRSRVEGGLDWLTMALPSWVSLAEAHDDIAELSSRVMTRPAPVQQWPDGFVEAAHRAVSNFDDDDDKDEIGRVFADFGIPVPPEEEDHDIDVVMTGATEWTPAESVVQDQLLNTYFTIEDIEESVRVSWRREFTLTRSGVGCTCDQVSEDDDDVRANLPDSYDTFEIDCNCA